MATALEGVRGHRHDPAALNPGKDPVYIVQDAGWAPGPVWTGAENLVPTGIRTPNRPARNQSLYRLRYPAHTVQEECYKNFNPYPTAFPYGNGMVLHFYQQQESSTTKTVHKVINKGLKTYV